MNILGSVRVNLYETSWEHTVPQLSTMKLDRITTISNSVKARDVNRLFMALFRAWFVE